MWQHLPAASRINPQVLILAARCTDLATVLLLSPLDTLSTHLPFCHLGYFVLQCVKRIPASESLIFCLLFWERFFPQISLCRSPGKWRCPDHSTGSSSPLPAQLTPSLPTALSSWWPLAPETFSFIGAFVYTPTCSPLHCSSGWSLLGAPHVLLITVSPAPHTGPVSSVNTYLNPHTAVLLTGCFLLSTGCPSALTFWELRASSCSCLVCVPFSCGVEVPRFWLCSSAESDVSHSGVILETLTSAHHCLWCCCG